MSDYAIYGKCNKEDVRLMIIKESDWSMEKDISPIPLTEPTNLYEENEYWVECTSGKKLVFIKDEVDEITAKGNVNAVLYWSAALNTDYWANDTLSNNEFGVSWSWDGSKWSATNSTGVAGVVYLLATGTGNWTSDFRPGFFKATLQYSGTPPTSTIGAFCSGKTVSYGGYTATFGSNGLIRSKSGLSTIISNGYDIERFGIIVPAGQTVSITGLWFSTQTWLPDFNTWVTHVDPTKWNDGGSADVAWNTVNEKWVVSGVCSMALTASGTWNSVGRPSAMKINFNYTDTDLMDIVLTDSAANILCDVDGVVPNQIIPITTQGNDIDSLTIALRGTSDCTGKTLDITDIQFYYGTNAITWGGYDNLDSAQKNAHNTSGTDDGAFYIRDMSFYGMTANITSGKELTFYSDTSVQFTAGLYNSSGTVVVSPVTSSGVDSLQEIKFTNVGNFIAVVQNTNPSEDWKDIFSYTLVTSVVDEGGEEGCPGYTDAATAMESENLIGGEDSAEFGDGEKIFDVETSKYLAVNRSTIEVVDQYTLTYNAYSSDGPFTLYVYEGTNTPIYGTPDDRTSTTYWGATMNKGTWVSGEGWQSGEGSGSENVVLLDEALKSGGSWVGDYRPDYIRINFTGVSSINVTLAHQDYASICTENNVSTNQALSILGYNGYNIKILEISSNAPFMVTSIEFMDNAGNSESIEVLNSWAATVGEGWSVTDAQQLTTLGVANIYTVLRNTHTECSNISIIPTRSLEEGGGGGESFDTAAEAAAWAYDNSIHSGYNSGEDISTLFVTAGKYSAIYYSNINLDGFDGEGSTIEIVEGGGNDVEAYSYYPGEPEWWRNETVGGEFAGPSIGGDGNLIQINHLSPISIVIYNRNASDLNYNLMFVPGNDTSGGEE